MWFGFSLVALLCWSGSDLFSKIGCRDRSESYAHLRMLTAVGFVMGLHAAFEIFILRVPFNFRVFLTYLPVSALYILSMAVGYLGLKYIELSISSPICNCSGAIVAVLTIAVSGASGISGLSLGAVALTSIGVIGLGLTEAHEDEELRQARQDASNFHYTKSVLAILLPLIYCLLDALGTFADSRVLETLDEDSANVAYELTFFAVGLCLALYLRLFRKEKGSFRPALPKYTGAVFETIGQYFYILALADTAHVALAAPLISSYCAVSVIWGRIFLKEKLSVKHYLCLLLTLAGIVLLGMEEL